jgi:antitoxin (DNA-binding transcriptional repressor) of toxin-antitoxin stability system
LYGVSAHAYELPAGQPSLDSALAEVEAGEIAYLTRAGQPVAALVPLPQLQELQDVSDAALLAELREMEARPGPLVPHEVVEAMMAADNQVHDAMAAALDAHADEYLSPEEVVALWKRISGRH